MNTITITDNMNTMTITDKDVDCRRTENHKTLNILIAGGGISLGGLLMFVGLILSAVKFFDKVNFHGWEVVSIAASFPLLAVGAHYLDKIETKKKKEHTGIERK